MGQRGSERCCGIAEQVRRVREREGEGGRGARGNCAIEGMGVSQHMIVGFLSQTLPALSSPPWRARPRTPCKMTGKHFFGASRAVLPSTADRCAERPGTTSAPSSFRLPNTGSSHK